MSRKIAEKNLETISRFGLYQGYTDTVYDGAQRVSTIWHLQTERV